jgi:quercetin dioxygenase-like cupin family protein
VPPTIDTAAIVIHCREFAQTLAGLTNGLNFRVEMIYPADAPSTAVVSGYGVTLRLVTTEKSEPQPHARLHLEYLGAHPGDSLNVPDLEIEWIDASRAHEVMVPAGSQSFVIARDGGDGSAWQTGRAGMQYRDLIPDRFGGRFIASHIRIPNGGPVADYVHFHRVRFQMIFCKSGWVRVVYEDQGEPFVMQAGDCVLQPPQIRHRVLASSDNLEVIEIGCPAIHETCADHLITLPTETHNAKREFLGQQFVRHVAANAEWTPWTWQRRDNTADGFEARDCGIASASDGLADARVIRCTAENAATQLAAHDGEFAFIFVLGGALQLHSGVHGDHALNEGDSVTLPAGDEFALRAVGGTSFLEVRLPSF